jgi:excisionase family DNA binding protein
MTQLAVRRKEAARMLGLSVRTLVNLEKRGMLKPVRVGRAVLFPVAELQRLVGVEQATR